LNAELGGCRLLLRASAPRVLEFNETLDLSNDQNLTEDFFRPLRSLVDRAPPPENRLIVVFTPLTSTVNFNGGLAESQGYTFLRSTTWLPWVFVDPREPDNYTLLHEIVTPADSHIGTALLWHRGCGPCPLRQFRACNLQLLLVCRTAT